MADKHLLGQEKTLLYILLMRCGFLIWPIMAVLGANSSL